MPVASVTCAIRPKSMIPFADAETRPVDEDQQCSHWKKACRWGFREVSGPCLSTACSCRLGDEFLVYTLEKSWFVCSFATANRFKRRSAASASWLSEAA